MKNKQNIHRLAEARANLKSTEQDRSKTSAKYNKLYSEFSKLYNELAWAEKVGAASVPV
jgi:hypothetical protein